MLLLYAISRVDPVIILGQALGVVVYARNLVLIHGQQEREAQKKSIALAETDDKSSTAPAETLPLRRAG
jgi:hypothetical protein